MTIMQNAPAANETARRSTRRVCVVLPIEVSDRIDALRAEAIAGGQRPTESATIVMLIRRGLEAVDADHRKEPAPAG